MSVLLVGFGYWGKNWGRTLHAMGELGVVCEANATLHEVIESQCPGTPVLTRLDEALSQPGIEAVVIATPAGTHHRVAHQCLVAGKHVLVEKPMTLDPQESRQLVQMAEQQGTVLAVGHLLLYHPALITLKRLIDAGELGEILSVQCTRVNLGKIRNEENAWWSLAPHDLSIIAFLTGETFEPVAATRMNLLGRPRIEDSVYAQFQTASGKAASVQVSWYAPDKKHETVVIGSRKIAVFDDALPAGEKLRLIDYTLDRPDLKTVNGITKGETLLVPYPPADDLLTLEAAAFLKAGREGLRISNDGRNGALVVRLLDHVQQMLHQPARKV